VILFLRYFRTEIELVSVNDVLLVFMLVLVLVSN
jgi:hypothetical protein